MTLVNTLVILGNKKKILLTKLWDFKIDLSVLDMTLKDICGMLFEPSDKNF